MELMIALGILQIAAAVCFAINAFIEHEYGSVQSKEAAKRSARVALILAVTSPLAFVVVPVAALYGVLWMVYRIVKIAVHG